MNSRKKTRGEKKEMERTERKFFPQLQSPNKRLFWFFSKRPPKIVACENHANVKALVFSSANKQPRAEKSPVLDGRSFGRSVVYFVVELLYCISRDEDLIASPRSLRFQSLLPRPCRRWPPAAATNWGLDSVCSQRKLTFPGLFREEKSLQLLFKKWIHDYEPFKKGSSMAQHNGTFLTF